MVWWLVASACRASRSTRRWCTNAYTTDPRRVLLILESPNFSPPIQVPQCDRLCRGRRVIAKELGELFDTHGGGTRVDGSETPNRDTAQQHEQQAGGMGMGRPGQWNFLHCGRGVIPV